MNAEELIGTQLGTCTLQRLIGQGGMGAVYLAQQTRPRRQVAVKVLLPAAALKPHQLAAFLERFRRETDAAASLEHPNIMPVYEYGERNGLAYLVMPYIRGGTLRDVMEREGQMALSKVVNYLEQLAAALDFAHARGVIHRDIKPANMLLTPEGRLLLTDFGLVKVIVDDQASQTRLTGAGAPVGTPDYMSPEQVLGEEVDGRADLYSLGVILFQMVTGTTPFQGETPMQIAAQQLHMQPPAPRLFRTDLPVAAEQVILRVLAKRPVDRYANAQELASAFRLALNAPEMLFYANQGAASGAVDLGSSGVFAPRGFFDPTWQTGTGTGALPWVMHEESKSVSVTTGTLPTANPPTRSSGLLSRAGMFPGVGNTSALPAKLTQMSPDLKRTTGSLAVPNYEQSNAGTIKLTGPVKVVQVPVAGQPGQYVTGLLPVVPQIQPPAETKPVSKKIQRMVLLVAMLLLIIGGSVGVFMRTRSAQTPTLQQTTNSGSAAKPDLKATEAARASATASANILLSDPLDQNYHNWPVATTGTKIYVFKNGAYHITNLGNEGIAVVLQASPYTQPIGYQLTMEEIKGDDTSINNSFGMILRYSQQIKGSQVINTFYSFEVVNTNGGEYRFYKYDNSQGSSANPWTLLWKQPFGHEFHEGHGLQSVNTIKVFANGNTFTFTVNGKVLPENVKDGSFKSGMVGMLVNLNGTEVAFSNMLITRN